MSLFDPKRHQLHLERSGKIFQDHRFLYDDIGAELIDRLQDIKRNFHKVLNLSTHPLPFHQDMGEIQQLSPPYPNLLNLPDQVFDLVISNLVFHWTEDIIGLLIQIRQTLKADGLFIASFFGGDSLHELRTSLMEAELELTGGASLRTGPMIRLQDTPTVLGRAGFALPVVDTEQLTITYPSLSAIVRDLRGMGETLKTTDFAPASRRLFERTEQIYFKNFGRKDGTLPVTVEIITLTGWSPCSSQQKPLERGSATETLESVLGE